MKGFKLFLVSLLFAITSNAQLFHRNSPRTVEEARKAELKRKAGLSNDSIYVEFIYHQPNYAEFVKLYAVSGWYKNLLVEKQKQKQKELKGYQLIFPAQQSLERVLAVTTFTHEMNRPIDYTYPRFYRNNPVEMPAETEVVNGILDGVYLRDTILRDFEKDHKTLLDSVRKSHEMYRNTTMQPFVTNLLQPFYFSETEVTVNEYRQFINWVRDSIAKRMIYFGLEDDKEAVKWLNIDAKKATKLDLSKREENLNQYGLNYDHELDYESEKIIPLLVDLYYPQPERFYKRREADVTKLIYTNNKGKLISVYPDTVSLINAMDYYNPLANMYFWHPAYDNYPILGLSYEQALAYCEWNQRQMNQILGKDGYQVEISIPTLFEYEMAAKLNVSKPGKHQVENLPNDAYHLYVRSNAWGNSVYLQSVYASYIPLDFEPGDEKGYQAAWKYNNWLRANAGFPVYTLNGGASEFCSTAVTPEMVEYYKLQSVSGKSLEEQVLVIGSNFKEDVIDLQGNQKNALFYKRIVPKNQTAAIHGFRTVIHLSKIK